jgi:predicted metal-binding membrane protein
MFADERHRIAARIAQKLRDADVGCELVEFLPTQAAVLRRDRIVVVLALIVLSALAWSYLLWLSADMGMGGMDMSDFGMIPSGMGLMVPAHTPWFAIEFAFVFVMWTVMMVAMMVPSALPMILMCGPAHAARRNSLFQHRLCPCVGRFLVVRHTGAMGT